MKDYITITHNGIMHYVYKGFFLYAGLTIIVLMILCLFLWLRGDFYKWCYREASSAKEWHKSIGKPENKL